MSKLSSVGFARRDDAHRVMAWGVDHHEETLFDLAQQLLALLTIAIPGIGLHKTIRIEERLDSIGEIESAFAKACFALGFIPFKVHKV